MHKHNKLKFVFFSCFCCLHIKMLTLNLNKLKPSNAVKNWFFFWPFLIRAIIRYEICIFWPESSSINNVTYNLVFFDTLFNCHAFLHSKKVCMYCRSKILEPPLGCYVIYARPLILFKKV